MTDAPRLLVSTPIEAALVQLEAKADDLAEWNEKVANAIRLSVAIVQQSMRDAAEHWANTTDCARLCGWSDETLSRHARLIEQGKAAWAWRAVEVRRTATGYLWRVSTVPVRARKAS